MFTGIIEEIGTVRQLRTGGSSAVLTIAASLVPADLHIGDSIAVNGACLTVTSFTPAVFTADVIHETLLKSSLGGLQPGASVNLERAMRVDGRFGGHIVAGHIDGTGTIISIRKDGVANRYAIRADPSILRCIVTKGSIAIDGVSLTVADVNQDSFCVFVIPHTASRTVLSQRRPGDLVNLENDCIGKYVERLLGQTDPQKGISEHFLSKYGF